jgi:hypothetical protein
VKGGIYDLFMVKLSPEDQQYVTVQLKGLQRDDLVNVLNVAVLAGQQQQPGAPTPPPATVAANIPPPAAPLGNDDLKNRLAQLNAMRGGNPDTETPPAKPLGNDDLRNRIAQLEQQKGAGVPTGPSRAEQIAQEQQARMEQQRQETEARMNQAAAEAQAQAQAQRQQIAEQSVPVYTPRLTKKCGKCGRALPDTLTAGDRCPGCGITFEYDETNGKRSKASTFGIIGGIVVVVIGFLIRRAISN